MKLWEAYILSATDEQITTAFQKRHGRLPAEIWRDKAIAHAGPITEDEHRQKRRQRNDSGQSVV